MEKDIEDIFKKIQAEEAGIRTFDDLAERFQGTFSCQNIDFSGDYLNI